MVTGTLKPLKEMMADPAFEPLTTPTPLSPSFLWSQLLPKAAIPLTW